MKSSLASHILMVRPASFGENVQTATTNLFQQKMPGYGHRQITQMAIAEFDNFVAILKQEGITVHVFDDTPMPVKPDAIFPNNWVTFHPDGEVILYPMNTPNRLAERRLDIIDTLKKHFVITGITDLFTTKTLDSKQYLEGTGSIVFDHANKIAYACLSPRTNKDLLLGLCSQLKYTPFTFTAKDHRGNEIYHTNVMMCIGDGFVVICNESISDQPEKKAMADSLHQSGRAVINITHQQMNRFAGNMLALKTKSGLNILVMSQSAFNSLLPEQVKTIQHTQCRLIPIPINTIETIGGGSARCMMAEIFLQPFISPV